MRKSQNRKWFPLCLRARTLPNAASASRLYRAPRPEILDQPEQYARAGVGVGEFDMLVGVVADTTAAAHEDHADIGDVDHRHAVMARAARQFEHAKTFARNGLRDLGSQPRRAWHGAVLMGDVELQRQVSPLGDRFVFPNDIGDRELAVRVGGGADIYG